MRSKELASGFVKQAGTAKNIIGNALGGATSGGIVGAGLGSLLGSTIGAVKNYRNSAGTFGNRVKAGLTGGLKGGAKGGLIGGGIGAGLGSILPSFTEELDARMTAVDALRELGNMKHLGYANTKNVYGPTKDLLFYFQGLNSNGDNYKNIHLLDDVFANSAKGEGPSLPILKRDALRKARELIAADGFSDSFSDSFFEGSILAPAGALYPLLFPKSSINSWRMTL